MDLLTQQPLLSTEEGTKGFDLEAGNRWIYPENYPLRQYQYTISETALFHNTLVCLPTGLGKTFIAAVVMYNYFRWYPKGIIVFLAPTKPLVAQQIDACHNVMGIPVSYTIELTGATNQKKREIAWREKRVIFATPQTFQKDLERKIIPTELIKCVVIDEAHRALGKHAYCESIRMMCEANGHFRILALSATPGGNIDAVQQVIRNLHITHLELRDDTSPDIAPYINERKLDVILVDLGRDLYQFKERYINIMDRHVKVLVENNVIRGYTANISKGRIFHIQREFQSRQNRSGNYGTIMKTLNILLTMYHAYELIIRHGLRAFCHFYQNHSEKTWLEGEVELQSLLEEIKEYIGPFPDVQSLMDGSVKEVPDNIVFGHGKFQKLRELLTRHFKEFENKDENTRAIVFIEYRDIVNEVYVLLMQSRPLIRPQIFVGQAGLRQAQQKKALENFRNNKTNVLISTSVGEEGLDVGEVDLIICFDISQHSPTRLVQRMGRTGRKRNGHIIVLVTDGKEHQTLKSALSRRDSLNNKVLHSSGVITALQGVSPRMIPENLNPECQKIHMTVIPKQLGRKNEKKVATKKISTARGKNAKKLEEQAKKNAQKGSLVKFLTSLPGASDDLDNDLISPKIQETKFTQNQITQSFRNNSSNLNVIRPCDVKLLTNDSETVEFLTLCALRQSERNNNDCNNDRKISNADDNDVIIDDHNGEMERSNLELPYVSENFQCYDQYSFFNFQIPNDSILSCIDKLKKHTEQVAKVSNTIVSERICAYDETSDKCKFEDLLNTSDSDCTEKKENLKQKSPSCSEHFDASSLNIDFSPGEKKLRRPIQNTAEDFPIEPAEILQVNEESSKSVKNERLNSTKLSATESAFEHILDDSSDGDSEETQFSFTNDLSENDVVKLEVQNNKLIDSEISVREISGSTSNAILTNDVEKINANPTTLLSGMLRKESQAPANTEKNDSVKILANPGVAEIQTSAYHDGRVSQVKVNPDPSTIIDVIDINSEFESWEDMAAIDAMPSVTSLCENSGLHQKQNSHDVEVIDDNKKFHVDGLQHTEGQQSNFYGKNAVTTGQKPIGEKSKLLQAKKSLPNTSNNSTDRISDDNIDWSSDFEEPLCSITKSNYFGEVAERSPIRVEKRSCDRQSDLKKVTSTCSTSKHKDKPQKDSQIKNNKLASIRETLFSKTSKKFIADDSESDDDFSTTKIEKSIRNQLQLSTVMYKNKCENVEGEKQPLRMRNFNECTKSNEMSASKAVKKVNSRVQSLSRKRSKKRRKNNDFIDDEAEVSGLSGSDCSNDDETEDDGADLIDFVSYTQCHDDSVDMKAFYLQSTRSPEKKSGYCIKKPTMLPPDVPIYSQDMADEPNSYLYDSFCVAGSENEVSPGEISPSEITIIEKNKPKLTGKRKQDSSQGSRKRRRIVIASDSTSSEDDIENIRAVIMQQTD